MTHSDRPLCFDADVILSLAADKKVLNAVLDYFGDRCTVVEPVVDELRNKVREMPPVPNARRGLEAALGMRRIEPADLGEDVVDQAAFYRQRLARPTDSHRKHLGEASSLAVARRLSAVVASDDSGARALAADTDVRVPVARTHHLLQRVVRAGDLDCKDAEAARDAMLRAGHYGVSDTDPVC